MEEEVATAKRQIAAAIGGAEVKKEKIDEKIEQIEKKLRGQHENEGVSVNSTIIKDRLNYLFQHTLLTFYRVCQ